MEEKTKICAIIGHRDIPEEKHDEIKQKITEELELAISDGFIIFISGFEDGADLIFAECVLALKTRYPRLFLEAALPYSSRMDNTNEKFQSLLKNCSGLQVVSEEDNSDCYMLQKRHIVGQSQRVIAVYDGRKSGNTVFAIRYAHAIGCELRVIEC